MDANAHSNDPLGEFDPVGSPILVPELRDYNRINAEVVHRLDRGDARVRVEGAGGHRLLLAGLVGAWRATVEILGDVGPELALGMNAPGVAIVCRGASADGAGSGLRAGTLLLMGPSGTAVGYHQEGGLIVAAAAVGPRAGLGMRGGDLVVLDSAGPLAGELQRGGRLLLPVDRIGPLRGRGATGGERRPIPAWSPPEVDAARRALRAAARLLAGFVASDSD